VADPGNGIGGGTPAPGRLELSAPADPAILDLVHAMLEHLWQAHTDVADRDRFRFETAVIEILGNIVEHAYELDHTAPPPPPEESRRFDICLSADDGELVASFGDNGLPVHLDLGHVAMPDEMAESGRGLALAAAAVDEVEYDRVEGRNHWRLRCLRSAT
jgi:serine/threonine-protein kinase RsbW